MIQIAGQFLYANEKNTFSEKEMTLLYPDDKGIERDGYYLVITNHHLVNNFLREMFFGYNVIIDIRKTYHYEIEKEVLFRIDVEINSEKEANRFLRKNKIRNMLEENE